MARDTDLGVYLNDTKTFYYLEAGPNWIGNTVDRVRKTLTQRGLIKIDVLSPNTLNYSVMTIAEAKKKDCECTPIYISKNVQNLAQAPSTKTNFK